MGDWWELVLAVVLFVAGSTGFLLAFPKKPGLGLAALVFILSASFPMAFWSTHHLR